LFYFLNAEIHVHIFYRVGYGFQITKYKEHMQFGTNNIKLHYFEKSVIML